MLVNRTPRSGLLRLFTLATIGIAIGVTLLGDRPLVDAVVVVGVGIVAPMALGRPMEWTIAALAISIGLVVNSETVATLLVLPALVTSTSSISTLLRHWASSSDGSIVGRVRSVYEVTELVAAVWGLVAVTSLMASTARLELFDIGEPIVRLTAVHYLYAGVGALTISRRLRLEQTSPSWLPTLAVLTTAVAPPIVAAGFLFGHPLPQIGGAVVMTIGIWSAATGLLASARHTTEPGMVIARVIAGLTPWVPMVLAVAWASAQHLAGVPALSVPDMARIHGLANGIGFVLLGLVATASSTTMTAPDRRSVGVAT